MQDLGLTPLCQITHHENIVGTHRKFFSTNFCLKCRKVPGAPGSYAPCPNLSCSGEMEIKDDATPNK